MFIHPHLGGKGKKKIGWYVDHIIYIAGIFGVSVYIPQLVKLYSEKNAEGLSILSWIGFIVGSLFWMVYGIVHKQKPIIFINASLATVQAIILVGIFIFGK